MPDFTTGREQGMQYTHADQEYEYQNTYTWFDASVDRIVPDIDTSNSILWLRSSTEAFYTRQIRTNAHNLPCPWSTDPLTSQYEKCHCATKARLGLPSRKDTSKSRGRDESGFEHRFRSVRSDFDLPKCAPQNTIQRNDGLSGKKNVHHVVTWRYDDVDESKSIDADEIVRHTGSLVNGDFVRKLEVGDCIALWVRGRRGNWETMVDRVQMHVYWAVWARLPHFRSCLNYIVLASLLVNLAFFFSAS